MKLAFVFATMLTLVGCGTSNLNSDSHKENLPENRVEPIVPKAPGKSKPTYSCSPDSVLTFRLDPQVDKRIEAGLEKALKNWKTALQGKFKYTIERNIPLVDGYESCVVQVRSDARENPRGAATSAIHTNVNSNTTAAAFLTYWLAEIATDIDDPEYVYALTLHELGHLLGLEHDENRDHKSVMWPFVTVPGQIGCTDVRTACIQWGCEPKCGSEESWIEETL